MKYLVDTKSYTVESLGFGINLTSGNYEFACLVTIIDENFWDEFSGECVPNWEAKDIQMYPSSEPDMLEELIHDPRWSDESLFAFVEGLRQLSKRYPNRVSWAPNIVRV